MGGGMEGPPVRGPAGPRFPLLPAATPPRQGRGLRPVRRWSKGGGGGGDYVWSIPWCPSLCPVCGRPRGMVGGGVQAWAGRVGSGGRPRGGAAPCGCGARGGRGAVWADRPAAGGGPESPTPWGRRARRGHACRAGLAVGGACARASARPMRAPPRAAGPAASWKRGLGAEAWAGRVGSGGRPRQRRRHAGAGPVAAAGRRRRTGRWPAAALSAPLHGVGGRAGGAGAWCGAGAQPCGAAQGRSSVGPRRGAARGCAGVQRGAA